MPDCDPKFDAISEMLALTSYGYGKNIIFSALELKGHVDTEAFSQAVQLSGQYFPNFLSTTKEIKTQGTLPPVQELENRPVTAILSAGTGNQRRLR